MIDKFKWFYKYYSDNSCLGGRVTRSKLTWIIKDKEELKLFLKTFYMPCPLMLEWGDMRENHYLLTPKWMIVNHLLGLWLIFSWKQPFKNIKYCWWAIKDIWYVMDDHEWYMNPTPARHGRKLSLIKYWIKCIRKKNYIKR